MFVVLLECQRLGFSLEIAEALKISKRAMMDYENFWLQIYVDHRELSQVDFPRGNVAQG